MSRNTTTIPLEPKWMPLIAQRLKDMQTLQLGTAERMLAAGDERRDRIHGEILRYAHALRREIEDFDAATLWWAAQDMTTLACATADDREGFDGHTEAAMPTEQGLIVWQGGINVEIGRPYPIARQERGPHAPIRVTGVYWDHIDGNDTRYWILADNPRMRWMSRDFGLPLTIMPAGPTREQIWHLDRVLRATWALIGQPSVAETRLAQWDEKHDGPEPRALKKASRQRRETVVRLVDARSNPVPHENGDGTATREYSRRWIVRGHYRNQPYGPDHALRRRQWIPPYIAGPADKPLVVKRTVHVWKSREEGDGPAAMPDDPPAVMAQDEPGRGLSL